ncbi:aspartate kinase [Ancylobacter sp. A5.8]|uniref:amino acid kinase family protein n=1 Tax=Ancylobacter gelatini TaxID=2919920 RepID=UPI001F4DC07D|nr:aspartate kinase [Ancylobacter gelatini]MCJ8144272.1 aspartate kinase [Ancylobacter gelatini]
MPNPTPHPAAAPPRLDIVKLGGSLTASARLPALLAHYAEIGPPVVLVPGGGPLADAVRALQPRLALSGHTAHHMAILAMEQTALAFADIEPRLIPCADAAAISRAHDDGRAALWLPAAMARAAQDLPESWDVTSDSLALWLGIQLGAARVVFVKSAPVVQPHGPPGDWAAAGLVDPHVPVLARRFAGRLEAASSDDVLEKGSRAA